MAGPAELLSVLRRGEPQYDTGLNPASSTTTATTSPVPLSALAGGPQGERGADFSLANRLAGYFPDFSAGTGVMGSPEANAALPPEEPAAPPVEDFSMFAPEADVAPLPLAPGRTGLTDVGNDQMTQVQALLTAYDSTGEADPSKQVDLYRRLMGSDEDEGVRLTAKQRIGLAILSIYHPELAMEQIASARTDAARRAARNRDRQTKALELGIEAAHRTTQSERDKLSFKLKALDTISALRRQPVEDALKDRLTESQISENTAQAAKARVDASGGGGANKPLTVAQRANLISRKVSARGIPVEEAAAEVDAEEAAARGGASSRTAATGVPAVSGPAVFTDSAGVSWDAAGNPIAPAGSAPSAAAPGANDTYEYRGKQYPTKAGVLAAARAVSSTEYNRIKAALGE
jgi:hypothetical protein